jgi:hypothetical protein
MRGRRWRVGRRGGAAALAILSVMTVLLVGTGDEQAFAAVTPSTATQHDAPISTVYVGGQKLVTVHLNTLTIGPPIEIPQIDLALSPDGQTAYATGYDPPTITPINLVTGMGSQSPAVAGRTSRPATHSIPSI